MGCQRNQKEDETSEHHSQTAFQCVKHSAPIVVPTRGPELLQIPIHLLQWTALVVQGSETLLSGPAVNTQFPLHKARSFFPVLILSMVLRSSCAGKTKCVCGGEMWSTRIPLIVAFATLSEHGTLPCNEISKDGVHLYTETYHKSNMQFKTLLCS